MEQVTLQAIAQKRLTRQGNGVTGETGSSDVFMQIIDNMLAGSVNGEELDVTDILTGETEDNAENGADSSVFAQLFALLQSGGGNYSGDVLEFIQNIGGVEEIDSVEIPNFVSELQESNFFEAMGMDDATADTLYTLGNNTHSFVSAQFNTIRDYVASRLESGDESTADTTTETVMQTGVLQDVVPSESNQTDSQKVDFGAGDLPITSMTFEKTTEQIVQPIVGVMVPNVASQRVVKADITPLQQSGEENQGNETQNTEFSEQSGEIAMADANVSFGMPEIELPKVETLSNPLFNEFNVSEQITDGVKANLNLEKTEFTVKLNPESLGEVTIKLVEEGGKMLLDITTASESTAKLLNSDLTALRDSLGNINLEIREVTVQAPETVDESIAQFNMTSQQFSDRRRAFNNQQQQEKPYYAAQHNNYSVEDVADYAGRVGIAVDGLDRYV